MSTGRTHRSNQVSAPEYIFLISALSGEQRFASIVAKRLESLGALTHGDRRATESRDLSKYNLDTKFGHQALEITLKSIAGLVQPSVKSPDEYTEEFFKSTFSVLSTCDIHMYMYVLYIWKFSSGAKFCRFRPLLL